MPVATNATFPKSRYSVVPAGPSSPDRKKSTKKENQFVLQKGSKLHAYARDKAPYPFSYDRDVLELSCIDHAFIYRLKQSVSFTDFKEDTPTRCLDLGTGLGDWVIDAAKQWEDCTFVGYDLINVQIPLSAIEPSVANRIEWIHGNFLRQKLPFEDDEFDHVHIQGLAFAVPENKWHTLYEEVRRVLRPGGTIEVIEEDAIFPVLPKWFTEPLHTPVPREPGAEESIDSGEQSSPLPQTTDSRPPSTDHLPHAHALLETLYYSVFQSRFLNPTPSSMLPSYFSAFFTHVLSPPVINFPMPPIAPLRPPPPPSGLDEPSLSSSSDDSDSPRSSGSDPFSDSAGISMHAPSFGRSSSISTANSMDSISSISSPKQQRHYVAYLHEEGTTIGGAKAVELFPLCDVSVLGEHSLYMQLQRAVILVLGLREAMWEELKDLIEKDQRSLKTYGWDENDFDEEGVAIRDYGRSRQKFDSMIEQYKSDMHVRVSLWYSMTKNGWQLPRRPPFSKAEHIVDQRLRQAVLNARNIAEDDEMSRPCRSVRLLVGTKSMS